MSPGVDSNSNSASTQHLANRVIEIYETLGTDNLNLAESLYSSDVHFEDPAHGIQGKTELLAYFANMFKNLQDCKFEFHQQMINGNDIFLTWTMRLTHPKLNGGQPIAVEGCSFLNTRDGQIYSHRDYFDMGVMVYEHLPLLGRIVKAIRHKLGQ